MSLFDKIHNQLHDPLHNLVTDIKNTISGKEGSQQQASGGSQGYQQQNVQTQQQSAQGGQGQNRFLSFAPERTGNSAKWYVDGCSYMYAVSLALERAQHTVWILDWWLSPELYLRRPPAKNEQYRVDRMLLAAAQRGVKVNIIVYKEVTQALTRKLLSPTLPAYLHSLLPHTTDIITKGLTRVGLEVIFKSLEAWEETDPLIAPPVTVSSSHTKHALEALHPNIGVFRHPDHLPDGAVLSSSFVNAFQNMSFSAASLSQLGGDGLKALYGARDGTVLFWAHHEKLCLIDGRIAFMGGLDLCYGRWDTNQHAIADAHPGNLDRIVFPGQDYNNARILGKLCPRYFKSCFGSIKTLNFQPWKTRSLFVISKLKPAPIEVESMEIGLYRASASHELDMLATLTTKQTFRMSLIGIKTKSTEPKALAWVGQMLRFVSLVQ